MIRIGYTPLTPLGAAVEHEYGKLSSPDPATPRGETTRFELPDSRVYPGTRRDVWVHTPAGADTTAPHHYCVFQDGGLYLDPDGPIRAGIVLDNLHALGLIRPTVGIFVAPGSVWRRRDAVTTKQRNIEYDPFTPTYGDFLRDEVLPAVAERIPLTRSPSGNVICGGSSGGNCAFTAAWYHQDLFDVAICFVSSFAQIPGGNPVPHALGALGAPARRLRVFQQIAHRDLNWDKADGNWVAENFRVAAALLEHGHDLRCVLGDGGHDPNHGGVLLPDALMWAAGTTDPS